MNAAKLRIALVFFLAVLAAASAHANGRYAFNNNPRHPNLTNDTGIPAAPFRSDDWPGPTDGKR